MRTIRRSVVSALVFALVVASVACNAKDALATALLGLQNAAIAANATVDQSTGQPELSQADAMHVVTYTTQALVTLEASSNGWQASLKTGWATFQPDIPSAAKTKFAVLIAAIDSAVNSL